MPGCPKERERERDGCSLKPAKRREQYDSEGEKIDDLSAVVGRGAGTRQTVRKAQSDFK